VLLVAEDEDINYMYVSELLSPTGVKFIWAKDGAQAVELVNSIKNINAILMDIKMPVMNGYAATLEIRQINPHIPIIAQTAYAYTEDRSKAEAAGCDDYITKPINSQELFEILDKYLG
jgi:CheY-like chemotaxis protein